MSSNLPRYADVILPLAVPQCYTYRIPNEMQTAICIGMRVSVILGKRKIYTAIIYKLHEDYSGDYETRDILALIDDHPVVNTMQLSFWEWLANYYMCTLGEVFKAAIPSGLKLASESRMSSADLEEEPLLSNTEQDILDRIRALPGISVSQLLKDTGKKDVLPILRRLTEKKLIAVDEFIKEKYKPKTKNFVRLNDAWSDASRCTELLNLLEKKAPGQYELLMRYLDLSGFEGTETCSAISAEKLLYKNTGARAALKALITKGYFMVSSQQVSRLSEEELQVKTPVDLNEKQAVALEKIKSLFQKKDVVLLHGVTSSGKTEIYIHLINEYTKQGKQVLYLLPEIALTSQIIQRLRNVFGNRVEIYHSKYSDAERVEIYQNVGGFSKNKGSSYQIILGVRSSVFLPFTDLGLVIIDEEHENTYKQFDPAPRYHARDAAIVLAGIYKAKVLMGTATPSFESYFNARKEKYGFVELTNRYLDMQIPEIEIVNTRELRRKKKMHSIFSPSLLQHIEETLARTEQVILFQNRRGFSPYIECHSCGWVPCCTHCDVSLTYHKKNNRLVCHYCGYSINNPVHCGSCGTTDMRTRGTGTEKIEEEIALFFPKARIQRMDLDSTRSRNSYSGIIGNFEKGNTDILIGTQMISKGLDFDNVAVVGVIDADNLLNFPDFRSYERTFQLISQVSGRAGRKKTDGRVIVQTANPENAVIRFLVRHDYAGFFRQQIAERKNFKYPPFYRLIKLTLRHKNLQTALNASESLAEQLRRFLGNRVIGPEYPLINRLYSLHQRCIIIKIERDPLFAQRKEQILKTIRNMQESDEFRNIQLIPDVDPYN